MGIFDWVTGGSPSPSSSSQSSPTPSITDRSGNVAMTPGPLVQTEARSDAIAPVAKSAQVGNPLNPEGLKPCCACPATKSLRDDCFLKSDPDTAQLDCKEFIAKHRECMAGYGSRDQ